MSGQVVVVGAGLMGTAAAWQLGLAGRRVVVLERFTPDHVFGASHGSTRNLSAAYVSSVYQELLSETRALWGRLESDSGRPLVDWVGLVQHGNQAELTELHAVHKASGIRSSFLSAADAEQRWTGLRFENRALFTEDAGRIRAADVLRAMRELAEAAGVEFRFEQRVRRIEVRGDLATIVLDEESITTDSVVVTAGAWTRGLLPSDFPLPPLTVTEEQPAHFVVVNQEAVWPGIMQTAELMPRDDYFRSTIYGMFSPPEGFKVGWHGVGAVTDPDERTFEYEVTQMEDLRRYVREWIPGVDPDRFDPISCTYTTTPTDDFVLDRWGPIVVGAGFSGHGFKFGPVVGRILADLVEGRPAPSLFALDR